MRRKLGIIAHSGVGKSALLKVLRDDPRLSQKRMIELDEALPVWFDPDHAESYDLPTSSDYWFWAKMSATRAAMAERADILAGLLAEGKIRSMLEARGYSLVVLSLPAAIHRARLEKRFTETGFQPNDIERCIRGQKRLEGLGYELIDADRPPEEIAADVAKRILDD